MVPLYPIITVHMLAGVTSHVRECLLYVTDKYMDTQTVLLYEWNKQKSSLILSVGDRQTVVRYNGRYLSVDGEPKTARIKGVVIDATLLKREELEISLEKVLTDTVWDSRSRILVILDKYSSLLVIFNLFWKKRRAENVTVMLTKNETIGFYTWFPYTLGQCNNATTPVLLDQYENEKFKYNAYLFPNKIHDLSQCVLRITTASDPSLSIGNIALQYGVETKLIQSIANFYNITTLFVPVPSGESVFISHTSSGSITGGFAMLNNQETDIVYGLLMFTKERIGVADPLISHMQDTLVWVVPPPNPPPNWKNIYIIFTPQLWSLVFATFTITSITIYLVAKTRSEKLFGTFQKCIFSAWQQWLNGSVSKMPKSVLLSLVLVMVSVYNVHINSAYGSYLITMLTTPLDGKPYQSVRQLAENHFTCFLPKGLESIFNQTDHSVWNKILENSVFSLDSAYSFKEVAKNKSSYLLNSELVTRFVINYKYTDNYGNKELLYLKPPYLCTNLALYMSRGNPLKQYFDKKIQHIIESGLIELWIQEMFNLIKFHSNQESKTVLTTQHLEGVFRILICGLTFSFLVFLIEIKF